jgi:glycosyltransferase involved in cell wall biosynthesis
VGNRPVRVLHIIDGLAGGGSERWVYDIARLSDHARVQHRVTTVHPDRGRFVYAAPLSEVGAYLKSSERMNRLRATPVRFPVAPLQARDPLQAAARVGWHLGVVYPTGAYRMLREWRRFRPDVVHGHTFQGFVFALGLATLARLPLVHTVPATVAQMNDSGFGWLPRLYTRAHKRVNRFLTAYPEELRRLGVPETKIHEIRGVVDTEAVAAALRNRPADRKRVREEIGAPESAIVVLSVGRLHPSKGHELGAETIADLGHSLGEVQWIVLGEGAGRRALEDRVRDLAIGDRTHILGFKRDALSYYSAADLYLRTNLLEAENQSSYQAMAMGLPVVGFDTGASTELLRDVGHGILVPLGETTLLAEAAASLLLSPDRGASRGSRGRHYAGAKLAIKGTIDDLTATYEELAGMAGQAGGA